MTKISTLTHKEKTYPQYLGKDLSELVQVGAQLTAKEIAQQPHCKLHFFLCQDKSELPR